jgi:hypothetical protein
MDLTHQLFGPVSNGPAPVGVFAFVVYWLLIIGSLSSAAPLHDVEHGRSIVCWWVLLGLITGGYLLVPDHLVIGHGGYIKQRLAVLIPLVLLTVFKEPSGACARSCSLGCVIVALLLMAYNMTQYISRENRVLNDYTAGVEMIGTRRVVASIQPDEARDGLADPLLHAACYYCLVNGSVNLDNYEAASQNFPIRFREADRWAPHPVGRSSSTLDRFPHREIIDTVIVWGVPQDELTNVLKGFHVLFSSDRLAVYQRE